MKNIWLKSALIAVAGFSMGSCSDFLDITPLNLVVEDNYWNEKSDVEQIMTGCYVRMQNYDFLSRAFVWGEARADNVAVGNTSAGHDEYEILQENILSTNSYASWAPFYSVINRCNLVIDRAPKVAEIDPDYSESEVRATIAEATGLRALCYFYLVRTFRDVPYYTYAITGDDQDLTLPVTKGETILDNLIEDLISVQGSAPQKFMNGSKDISYGRMTRTAIWALIADICLWQNDYARAAEYAGMVIDYKNKSNIYSEDFDVTSSDYVTGYMSMGYDGKHYPLLDDYMSMGTTVIGGSAFTTIFGTGGSSESIFELQFEDPTTESNGMGNDMIDAFFYRYVKRNSGEAARGVFSASKELVNQFAVNQGVTGAVFLGWNTATNTTELTTPDARLVEAIDFSSGTVGNVADGVLVKYNATNYNAYPKGNSSTYQVISTRMTNTRNDANWIFYRTSDVMLIRAEALVNGYPGDEEKMKEAFNLVKAVNDRSNMERNSSGSTVNSTLTYEAYDNQASLNSLILEERRREFLFEGKRWFDLVRWSRRVGGTTLLRERCVAKMTTGATSGSGKLTSMDGIYWPYAKTEIQTNPNLTQNPAYPEVGESYE